MVRLGTATMWRTARSKIVGDYRWSSRARPWGPAAAARDNGRDTDNVRFSNRPSWVKRFQAIHCCGVDVTRGLVLLFGIGSSGELPRIQLAWRPIPVMSDLPWQPKWLHPGL